MTDRAEALRALIEKVEAGECPEPESLIWIDAGRALNGATAWMAFHSSIDASKALHEAVLPGWTFTVTESGSRVDETQDDGVHVLGMHKSFRGSSDVPARAWLLAILRALLSMEGEA